MTLAHVGYLDYNRAYNNEYAIISINLWIFGDGDDGETQYTTTPPKTLRWNAYNRNLLVTLSTLSALSLHSIIDWKVTRCAVPVSLGVRPSFGRVIVVVVTPRSSSFVCVPVPAAVPVGSFSPPPLPAPPAAPFTPRFLEPAFVPPIVEGFVREKKLLIRSNGVGRFSLSFSSFCICSVTSCSTSCMENTLFLKSDMISSSSSSTVRPSEPDVLRRRGKPTVVVPYVSSV
uniref:Uncharacterized protein n=1 Tax=Anopheles culicifacies TaxID=139723 RepID=A0A182MH18_9DIPT